MKIEILALLGPVVGFVLGWLARARPSSQALVLAFHKKFRIPYQLHPYVPPEARVRLRLRLMFEELFEWVEASFDQHPDVHNSEAYQGIIAFGDARRAVYKYIDEAPVRVDMVQTSDAMIDTKYILEGGLVEYGFAGAPLFREVHRTNMLKVGGPTREDGKIMKPPGWKKPDLHRLLVAQGWDGRDHTNEERSQPRKAVEASTPATGFTPPHDAA